MNIASPRSTRRARIEIIPLIDIIFFLLATFVMVSLSMVKNNAIPVNLPQATSGGPQDNSEFSSISITAAGEIFFNKRPVTRKELDAAIEELLATNRDPRILINGDAKSEFGIAIAVLDQVRKLGVARIALATTAKPEQ